jgi:hypothetical protein
MYLPDASGIRAELILCLLIVHYLTAEFVNLGTTCFDMKCFFFIGKYI